jgi:hypothetical protein
MTFAKLCRSHNVLIVTPVLTYDLTQEIYWEMYEIEVKNAARELKVLQFRLGGAKALKARNGFWDGRPVCWGYVVDLDPKSPTYQKLVVYPPHQKILLELFELAAKHTSYRSLSQAIVKNRLSFPAFPTEIKEQQFDRHSMRNCNLNPDGSYTPSLHALDSILTNPTPIGWWSTGNALLKNNHDAALPEDIFWRVQEIYNAIDYRTGSPNPSYQHEAIGGASSGASLLSGKLYCGMHPGDGLTSQHRIQAKGSYQRKDHTTRYYGCTADYDNGLADEKCLLVTQDPIVRTVVGHVLSCLASHDLAEDVAAIVKDRLSGGSKRTKEVGKQRRLLSEEIRGLKRQLPWAKTRRDSDLLMEEIHSRETRIETLEKASTREATNPIEPIHIENVRAFVTLITKHWNRVSLEARRRLLDILLSRVTVFHDETLRLELHLEWRTGAVDILETLRPLPSRPPGWRWEAWEDEALRRLYATELAPAKILQELKPMRNWASAMERAWKLGLKRPRDLTPFGLGRAALAPIRERPTMNPTGLQANGFSHIGTIWQSDYYAPEGRDSSGPVAWFLQNSPAIRQEQANNQAMSSSGFLAASFRGYAAQTPAARPETAPHDAPG